ncbi:hypothetical protein ACOME3_009230 [Neoechinorhynchus agilis]
MKKVAADVNYPKICPICHVTKFVSSTAINRCSFCGQAFCSRCGLRTTRPLAQSDDTIAVASFTTWWWWCSRCKNTKLSSRRSTTSLRPEEKHHDVTNHQRGPAKGRRSLSEQKEATTRQSFASRSLDYEDCHDTTNQQDTCGDGWIFDETQTYATIRLYIKSTVWTSRQYNTITIHPSGVTAHLEIVNNSEYSEPITSLVIENVAANAPSPLNVMKRGDRILEWNRNVISQLRCDIDNDPYSSIDKVIAGKLEDIVVLRIQSARSNLDGGSSISVRTGSASANTENPVTPSFQFSFDNSDTSSFTGETKIVHSRLLPQRLQPKVQLSLLHDQSSLTLLVGIFGFKDGIMEMDRIEGDFIKNTTRQCYLICRAALTPDPTGQFLRLHTRPVLATMNIISGTEQDGTAISYSNINWNESLSFHPLSIADLLDFSLLVSVFSYSSDLHVRYQLVGQTSVELTHFTTFSSFTEAQCVDSAKWFPLSNSESLVTPTISTLSSIDDVTNGGFVGILSDAEPVSLALKRNDEASGNYAQRRQLPPIPIKALNPQEKFDNNEEELKVDNSSDRSEKVPPEKPIESSGDLWKQYRRALFCEGIRKADFERKRRNDSIYMTNNFAGFCGDDTRIHTNKTDKDSVQTGNSLNTNIEGTEANVINSIGTENESDVNLQHHKFKITSLPSLNTWKSGYSSVDPETMTTTMDSDLASAPIARHKHSTSETVVSGTGDGKRKQSVAKALVILGLTRRTDAARRAQRRSGFLRSEEIGVHDLLKSRYASSTDASPSNPANLSTETPDRMRMPRPQSSFWSGGLKLPHERAFAAFVEGLGMGQLVGRQVLGSACLGEILLHLRIYEGFLQVKVEKCKNLTYGSDLSCSKSLLPACYVKLIIYKDLSGMNAGDSIINHEKDSPFGTRTSKSIEKVRTTLSQRSLNPVFDEILTFGDTYRRHILQVLVIGERGKLDRKLFMGTVQIDMSQLQLWAGAPWMSDWYKLFSSSSVLAYPCTPTGCSDSQQQPIVKSNKAL